MGKKIILENLSQDIISIHSINNIPKIREATLAKKIPYIVHGDAKFLDSLGVNHQGVVAFLKNKDFLTDNFDKWIEQVNKSTKKYKVVLILDRIEDVGNFGSIIRTANCFDVDGVIIKNKEQAPINEVVINNSKGTIFNTNILETSSLSKVIDMMKSLNFWVVSSLIEGAQNYNEIKYDFNCCLIIGNENKGISKKIAEKSDFKVKIPMFGSADSLNVSVATGILLSFIKINN